MFRAVHRRGLRRWLLLALGLLAACSQAGNPSPSGTALAGGAGGGAGGSGAGSSVTALISAGSLSSRFPTMSRLQLSITAPAGTPGMPMQLNLPIDGQAVPLVLPVGVPLGFTFDVFDAAGNYLASGSQTKTLQANTNPVIPVNVNPVPPGIPYVDPITGLTGTGPVVPLTVSVITGASQQPLSGAVVSLGPGGTATAVTDASGLASFASAPMPQDVHVFFGGNAVSVLAFSGSALVVPMPETAPISATVSINPPSGPTLGANELLDVYLTDGMSVSGIPWLSNPATSSIPPMRGPVGVSAMIENPLDLTPRPDLGLAMASVAAGHHAASPLSLTLPDPATQPRYAPIGLSITAPVQVGGMQPTAVVSAEVLANLGGGDFRFVSHKDNNLLAANRRDISIWPVTASGFVLHVSVTDTYASSEAWTRAVTAGGLTPPLTYPPVPAVNATATSVAWIDPYAHAWDGFVVHLAQGPRIWNIHGLAAGTSFTLPTVPATATNPLSPGIAATASVDEYVLDPAAGFSVASPDLWYLPRMLDQRARSATVSFVP